MSHTDILVFFGLIESRSVSSNKTFKSPSGKQWRQGRLNVTNALIFCSSARGSFTFQLFWPKHFTTCWWMEKDWIQIFLQYKFKGSPTIRKYVSIWALPKWVGSRNPCPNGLWQFFNEHKPLLRHLNFIIFHQYLPWFPSEYHIRIIFYHSHPKIFIPKVKITVLRIFLFPVKKTCTKCPNVQI